MKVVYLNDTGIDYEHAGQHFDDVAEWAKINCPSFLGYYIQDVSDVSYQYDFVTEYRFNDPRDAVWFSLKWKNS